MAAETSAAAKPCGSPSSARRSRIRRRKASSSPASAACIVDSNWLSWASSAASLRLDERRHVLDVRRGRRPPTGTALGSVVGEPVLGEEVRIARRDDGVAHEPSSVAVVGVQPVPLPRVMPHHDLRPQLTDDARHLARRRPVARQVTVHPIEEADLAGPVAGQPAGRLALLDPAAGDEGREIGSRVPGALDPSVQIRWWTTHPLAAHLASVPPAPNSTSSGWAPMARTDEGTGRSAVMTAEPSAAVRPGWPGSFAATAGGSARQWGGAGRPGCRRRSPAGDRRAPRRAGPSPSPDQGDG